jgi:hypothetical protein
MAKNRTSNGSRFKSQGEFYLVLENQANFAFLKRYQYNVYLDFFIRYLRMNRDVASFYILFKTNYNSD